MKIGMYAALIQIDNKGITIKAFGKMENFAFCKQAFEKKIKVDLREREPFYMAFTFASVVFS